MRKSKTLKKVGCALRTLPLLINELCGCLHLKENRHEPNAEELRNDFAVYLARRDGNYSAWGADNYLCSYRGDLGHFGDCCRDSDSLATLKKMFQGTWLSVQSTSLTPRGAGLRDTQCPIIYLS